MKKILIGYFFNMRPFTLEVVHKNPDRLTITEDRNTAGS